MLERDGPTRDLTWPVRLAAMVLVFGAWEFFGRRISPLLLSSPSAIAEAAMRMLASGELAAALSSSLRVLSLGFVLAAAFGVALGVAIGRYRLFDAATDWLVNALYATPLIAITPLVVLWFGFGEAAKLFIVTLMAMFPILINTAAGVRNVPNSLLDVAAAFHAREWQTLTKFILPGALPYIMTGMRLGIGRAIIGMVAAEFFTAITGLGALIVKFGNQFDTASMFVPILALMALASALAAVMRQIENRLSPWRGRDD